MVGPQGREPGCDPRRPGRRGPARRHRGVDRRGTSPAAGPDGRAGRAQPAGGACRVTRAGPLDAAAPARRRHRRRYVAGSRSAGGRGAPAGTGARGGAGGFRQDPHAERPTVAPRRRPGGGTVARHRRGLQQPGGDGDARAAAATRPADPDDSLTRLADRPRPPARRCAARRAGGARPAAAAPAPHPAGRQRHLRAVHRGAGRRADRPAAPRAGGGRAQRRAGLRRHLRDLPGGTGRAGRMRLRRASLRGHPAAAGRPRAAGALAAALPAPAGGRVPGPHPGVPAAAASAGLARPELVRRGRRRSDHLRLRGSRPEVPAGLRAAVPRRRRGRPGGVLPLPAGSGDGGRAPAGQQPAPGTQGGAGGVRRGSSPDWLGCLSCLGRRQSGRIQDHAGARRGDGCDGSRGRDRLAGRRGGGGRHRRAGAGQLDAATGLGGTGRSRRGHPLRARHAPDVPEPGAGRAGLDAAGVASRLDGSPRPHRGGAATRPKDQPAVPGTPGWRLGRVAGAVGRSRRQTDRAAAGILEWFRRRHRGRLPPCRRRL